MTEFDLKYNIVDEITPPNVPLRAHYKRSFAYYTIRERLPVILTQVIDQLSRDKELIAADRGDEGVKDEIKDIQGGISKLKYEMQTDKKFTELTGMEIDKDQWNAFLATLTDDNNSYFTTTWLYTECYMYRRLKSLFEKTNFMKDFDYFGKQKENALNTAHETMILVAEHIKEAFQPSAIISDELLSQFFTRLLKLCLWGNRCDLSISVGKEIKQTGNPFMAIDSLDDYILVDKCQDIWQCISDGMRSGREVIIDFVQDNSGYELFTDFVLANFLIEHKLAAKVRFHVKAIPWFISDVMTTDFHWTIDQLTKHQNVALSELGGKLAAHLAAGSFILCNVDYFWTGPFEFYRMADVRPDLYQLLAESHLVVFKGDLNYRKLLGDFNWPFATRFKETLRGFQPSNVCTLRTVKADLICELKEGVAEELQKVDPMWMETGQYGVIQFSGLNRS